MDNDKKPAEYIKELNDEIPQPFDGCGSFLMWTFAVFMMMVIGCSVITSSHEREPSNKEKMEELLIDMKYHDKRMREKQLYGE